jgi:uncharacterized protein YjiS (DUF1127 family)
MSIFAHESMTNDHGYGVLGQLEETFHVWRHRYQTRRELARWSERDLHDIGLSWADIADEADKPFWRA